MFSGIGLTCHQLLFQSLNAFHNYTTEFPRVSFEDLQAGTGGVSMLMPVIALVSPHGLDKRLRVGGPLRGLLDRISRSIFCACHALVHSLRNNRVVCDNRSPWLDIIDPGPRRLLAEKVSPEFHLFKCNLSTELDVRQVLLVMAVPCFIVHDAIVVRVWTSGTAVGL